MLVKIPLSTILHILPTSNTTRMDQRICGINRPKSILNMGSFRQSDIRHLLLLQCNRRTTLIQLRHSFQGTSANNTRNMASLSSSREKPEGGTNAGSLAKLLNYESPEKSSFLRHLRKDSRQIKPRDSSARCNTNFKFYQTRILQMYQVILILGLNQIKYPMRGNSDSSKMRIICSISCKSKRSRIKSFK